MKKKWIALALALALLLSLAACGGGSTDNSGDTAGETSSSGGETEGYMDNLSWWEDSWYGWWCIMNSTGIYEPANKIAWDAYAESEILDGKVHWHIWDTGTTKDEPLIFGYTEQAAGAGELGKMVSYKVDFFPYNKWNNGSAASRMELSPGDWDFDPADSSVSKFENMIEIKGHYVSPENEADSFDYYIYLKPWGNKWDDVKDGDTEGCIFKDMMPLYYNEIYLQLLALDYIHPPKSYDEAVSIINEAAAAYQAAQQGGAQGGGSAAASDLGDKASADGKVSLQTLKDNFEFCVKSGRSYSTTYDEFAARFGAHGLQKKSLFEGKSIYRWWATDDDYIEITFDIHDDGSETWNVTQYKGIE